MRNANKQSVFAQIMAKERSAFLIDMSHFEENLDLLSAAFVKYYPKVNIGYSYKTNYIPSICNAAHQKGCWAEVVSEMEVDMALYNLEDKSKIIFNGPVKTKKSIMKVMEQGGIINIDHMLDLDYIEELTAKSKSDLKAKLALRLNFSFDSQDSRFGSDRDEIYRLRERIYCNSKLELIGYHLHLPFRSIESYKFRVKSIIDVLKSHGDRPLKYINIGGGFFGRISPELAMSLGLDTVPDYDAYGKAIGEELSAYFEESNTQDWPDLFIEPGSSVIADAVYFLSRIHAVKKIDDQNIIVTYAARHLLSPTNKTIQLPIEIYTFNQNVNTGENFGTNYQVAGYTCIESDIVGTLITPIVPDKQSFIAISNVGSYSIVMGSDFILPQPAIYSFIDKKVHLVRNSKNVSEILNSFIQ